jgi:prolyl oligopeptidase PreP (S9A serine peptidase family)
LQRKKERPGGNRETKGSKMTPPALSRSVALVLLLSSCLCFFLAFASAAAAPPPPVRTGAPLGGVALPPGISYPKAARGGDADVLGTWVAKDPYRWMEDPEAAATKEFVAAENGLTSRVLESLPLRSSLKTAMAAAYDYEKWGIPFKAGGRYFYRRNAGLKNQPILYSRPSLDGPPSVVLDPNVLRADGTVALQEYSVSHDGMFLAAAFSTGGSDWRTVRIFRVGGGSGSGSGSGDGDGDETENPSPAGRPLPETLSHVKFTELSWTRDSKGFFYSRYDPPPLGAGGETGTSNAADSVQQLWYHVVGTPQSRDARVFSASAPTDFLTATATGDGEHLILSAESTQSAARSKLLIAKISSLPRDPVSGALDLSKFDLSAPAKAAAKAAAKASNLAMRDDGSASAAAAAESSSAASFSVASVQAAVSEDEEKTTTPVAAAANASSSSPSPTSTLTSSSSSSASAPIPFPWISLPTHGGYEFRYVAGFGSKLYFMTTFNAARYRIVRIDASAPTRGGGAGGGGAGGGLDSPLGSSAAALPSSTPSTTATWVEVVAEDSRDLLQSASPSVGPDGKPALLLTYLHDVKGALRLVKAADGAKIADIPLPGPGAVSASSDRDSSEIFFKFASFTNPGTVYRFDAAQPKTLPTIWKTSPIHGVDLSAFSTSQVFVPSADGRANIPLFITAKKNLKLDGSHPAVLYGYGGFNIVNGVEFQPDVLVAAQAFGSVYASCGMRGGGEYGERWHSDGVVANKQNTYDDFVSCAEYLLKAGYTSPARLSIHGASFGGTLVATVANQRPDLFACVLCDVPVTDIARFHKVRRRSLGDRTEG